MDANASSAPINPAPVPLRETISQRAHQLWEQAGQPHGRDVEFWLEAERQVLGADGTVIKEGSASISAQQYADATDANHARANRKAKK